jgi:2-polyprenyl-6-methoxyphenol hydroxylase-like FAD-dependent oxidoreductase
MLRAEAEARGSTVLWGRTVTDIEDDGKKVVTTLDDGETIESRWFVGCDGASSWTRKFIGLQLEDLRFDQEWLVVDAELHEGVVVDLPVGVRQFCHTDRPFTFVQGVRRYRRWEFQVQDGEDAAALNTEEGLWQLLDGMISPVTARIVRSAVYRFHAVVAPVMQKGNVFLAGDSAHQTPPFAGQGLNSGMRDAINLAWKFSFITRGVSSEKILDTYSPERVPHVRSTIAHAVDMGRLIDQLGGRVSHGVDVESGYGGTRPSPFIEAGIVIGDDPRVGHQFWFHPEVSKAVRTDRASFVLVTAAPVDIPASFGAVPIVNVVAPETLGDAFAIVVRPDRYVAAVASDMAELIQCAANLATYV